jgi:uncharacterized protein (DUF58 family)
MSWPKRLTAWLETHWVAPAYSGWLLLTLALCFFIAATNTLSGWLYVMSGGIFALLTIAALLSYRTLHPCQVRRSLIEPVTAGEDLQISITLTNTTASAKLLLQVQDYLSPNLGQPIQQVIECLPARSSYTLTYTCPTTQRGVYRWQNIELRTAAPFGLFWCRRRWRDRAIATVYPSILPLQTCPLLDKMGRELNAQVLDHRHAHADVSGVTRSLRPYRWGDPMRLIHWCSSARYGELRVREMESWSSGQAVVICLDSAMSWEAEHFEQAVLAAAALYCYGIRQQLKVTFWTAGTGLVQGVQPILQTLARVMPGEAVRAEALPSSPLLWLTSNLASLDSLSSDSRWLLWQSHSLTLLRPPLPPGMVMDGETSLQQQLQRPPRVTGSGRVSSPLQRP